MNLKGTMQITLIDDIPTFDGEPELYFDWI